MIYDFDEMRMSDLGVGRVEERARAQGRECEEGGGRESARARRSSRPHLVFCR
jgi:hypothetical protein